MERYLQIADVHAGWEFVHRRGHREVQTTHDEPSIKIALEFANDFQPDTIVFSGDQINCAPVGHWNANFPGRNGMFRLKDELDYFNDVVLAGFRSKKKVRRIWHRGNHEKWFTDLLERYPGLDGLTSIEQYLRLEARGFEIYDYGEASQVGKLKFVHGDKIPGGVNVARIAALRHNTNLRFGHFHTFQAYTLHNPLEVTDVKTCVSVPCLANRGPEYGGNAVNNHINGFGYGYIDEPTGNYSDYVAIIANGSVVVEGKKYGV